VPRLIPENQYTDWLAHISIGANSQVAIMKTCSKCKVAHPATREYFNKKLDGLVSQCKKCRSNARRNECRSKKDTENESRRARRAENPEHFKLLDRKRYSKNREKIRENAKARRDSCPDVIERQRLSDKTYYRRNRESIIKKSAEYVENNLSAVRARQRKWYAERRKRDPVFAMALNCRSLVQHAFKSKGLTKDSKTMHLLGCSWSELAVHFEKQFTKGMTWENKGEWHIDHITPISSAKTKQDIISLSHHTNLRPIWAHENISKSDRMEFLI